MKVNKKIVIWITVVIAVYIVLCLVECIRFRNSEMYTKPLITLSENTEDKHAEYCGLGYSVEYTTTTEPYEKKGKTYDIPVSCKATVKLFGVRILDWSEYSPLDKTGE
ncbi:MAG: hypothetical protein K2K16_13040 [Ruminococcus sp.]|nr:hypothetical protein [Ruminococcus sp.]